MNSKKMPIIEIINLVKQRAKTIVVILCITIISSYLYNKNLKKIFYNYSLEFITLSEWKASEIGIASKSINGLIRNLILASLNDFDPDDTNVMIDESYVSISFKSIQQIDVKLFFEKLSGDVNKNINNFLSSKYSLLESEERYLVRDIEKIINEHRLEMKIELQALQSERENIQKIFGKIINNPIDNENLLGGTEYELIKNYYLLEKKITQLMKQINLNIPDYENRNDPLYASKAEELSILRQKKNNLKYQIKVYENPNFKSIKKIGNWTVKSNHLTLMEIILAGILFGILLNTLYLFLTSKYFRNMKI
jgi:hypothetical protein